MRFHRNWMAGVVLGAALLAGACDNGLADVNQNPNQPEDVGAQYLLPRAIVQTVEFGGQNTWFTLEFSGLFAQHWGKIQYTDEDRYLLRPNVIDAFWNGMYAGPLMDWQLIIDKGAAITAAGDANRGNNIQAIGMIGKAYLASIMTDIWGDIPYSQALQADDPDAPTTAPVYDEQSVLYATLLDELETAAGMLNTAGDVFGDADLLFGGDVEAWEKFANSLRLRLAVRMSDANEAAAQPIIEALAADMGTLITDNADNVAFQYTSAAPYRNPLHENAAGGLGGAGTRDDHAVSNTLVSIMGALNDPRLELYANPVEVDSLTFDEDWCGGAGQLPCHVVYNGEVYRGIRNGLLSADVPRFAIISRLGSYFRANPDTPQPLITAAEVNFLLAEAALKGYAVGGTAQSFYEAGIRAAFDQWDGAGGVDLGTAAQTAYLLQPGVAWGTGDGAGTEGMLEQIIEQKWLALYTMPWEAYAELRRTGYPDEAEPAEAAAFDYIPGRIPYPSLEQSLNAENRAAAVARQTTTNGQYDGTVWWDTTPQQ